MYTVHVFIPYDIQYVNDSVWETKQVVFHSFAYVC